MLLLTALLAASLEASAQTANGYVIYCGDYGLFLAHDASGNVNLTGVSTFDPATCLWTVGTYIRPASDNGTTVLGNLYLCPRNGNNSYTLNTSTSNTYRAWGGGLSDGNQPYYNNNHCLRVTGGTTWQIGGNSRRGTVYAVSKQQTVNNVAAAYAGTLSSTAELIGVGATSTVTPSATRTEAYTTTTVTYTYSGGTLGSTTTGTVPTPTAVSLASGWTLSWSLSDDTYATISDDGVVTVGSTLPATYATTTVTLTATRTDGTGSFTATMPLTIYASEEALEIVGGMQGISGGIVTLNDYEDHSWSYYSDTTLPVRMRSLLPANVVVKYYGNGTNTVSTSSDAAPALNTFTAPTNNSVAVGIGEPEHTFVYYKTLERTSGSAYGTATYNYTTIPNPFSIRPTYGSDDTRWRGFYAWRVKSVSGGTISGKAEGDIIDAEATVSFIPTAEYGMTVELEALWARAYVGSGLQASVGRERNFIIVTSNTGSTMDAVKVNTPCTYSSFYPNGTNGTTAATLANRATRRATFTATADSRIEYMLLDGNSYNMSANANSLTLGRGIGATGGTYSCYTFSAINANHSEDLDFTVRIESGVYHDVDLMATGNTLEGRVHNHFFFGSDYDRARGDNSKLDVAPTGTTEIHFATPKIDEVNKDKPVLDIVVKSGDYQKNRWYDNNTSAYNYSFYCHSTENASYPGLVSMTVEGGHFANINGGRGTYTEGHITPDSLAFTMRMRGGIVENSIYGAASNNPTFGSRRIIFTGGEVKGWVVAGCNGTGYTDNNAHVTGNSYIYVGGNTKIGNDTALRVNNETPGGSVYGAGRGNDNHRASITNSHVAVADNADILENLFGGGFHGYITDTSNVFILGGTVHGRVYGGGSENGDVSASIPRRIPIVNVIMTGGLVEGGVYGGSYTRGIVTDQVNMYINGGQVGTSSQHANVHGGGLGHETRVLGSVNVNVGTDCHATTGAVIYGDVYGGSAEGRTNGDNGRNGSAVTNVNLYSGTIYGGLYGGGLGTATYPAYVYGPVAVKVYGGSVRTNDGSGENGSGGVFGCNNVNGTPQSTVNVDIYGTDPAPDANSFALFAVYGGGNRSHYTADVPIVTIHGCNNSIEYVYGGGNASNVPGTDVTIWGGHIGNAFGGGNGYSVADNHDDDSAPHYNPGANITASGANLTIHGGTIDAAFGGSNQWGYINGGITVAVAEQDESGSNPCTGAAYGSCSNLIVELYGGGNQAPAVTSGDVYISPDVTISSCDMKITNLFGGAKNANHGANINLVVTKGQFENVFGGNNLGGTITGNITLTLKGGTMVNAFGGNNQGGTISGTITVLVDSTGNECPLKVDNVYGGGNEAPYAPATATATTPVVNVVNGTVRNAVFGGGLGAAAKITANPTVTIGGTGGKHAIVGGTRIDGTKGDGNVYGGGSQADVLKNGDNTGNTTVTLTGKATVKGNVYGGGNEANVEGDTDVKLQ